MIVDDEILARVGIKSLISWEEHGFLLVGEAENGKKALEMVKDLSPDIIITDIKMPQLNGIGLIKSLKELKSPAKFVVLSSYDDFEYVKEAMKVGAEDYILKLEMEPDKLLDILNRVKEKITQERNEKIAIQEEKRQYHVSMPVLKEKFFKDLVCGVINKDAEIEERLRFLGIVLPEKNLLCMVMLVDNRDIYNKYTEEDEHLLTFSINNVAQEILSECGYGYVFATKPMEFSIVYSVESITPMNDFYENIARLTNKLKSALKNYLNVSVSIGISNIHKDYSHIRLAYRQALEAARKSFIMPRGSTIMYQDISRYTEEGSTSFAEELKLLERAFNAADISKINLAFKLIEQKLTGCTSISKELLKGMCYTAVFVIHSFMEEYGVPIDSLWTSNDEPYKQIEQLMVLSDFIQWLENLRKKVLEVLQLMADSNSIVVKAKQYINENYNKDISLNLLANRLNVSSNYLSNLFKKDTGVNFIDYLTGVRIGRAKELLKTSDSKIHEIGESVGYDNIHYFSKIFKKVTGVTPQQFRANSFISGECGTAKDM